jgi:hypothetical protein
MKKCLQCEQVYGDDTNFCLSDGTTLVSVSGSFTSFDETPTVFSNAPAPTVQSNTPFIPPVSSAPVETNKSRTLLIALVVGFFALVIGGAVVGLVMYGLFGPAKKGANVAANVSNSAEKSNKNASAEQSSGSENTAQNLKEQQDKLARDKQKLEDERQALEAKKKETTPPQPPPNSRTATIIDPPSNIRAAPNGSVLCIARTRGTVVNILGPTGVTDNNGTWYYTDYCGSRGVIHSSQIRF